MAELSKLTSWLGGFQRLLDKPRARRAVTIIQKMMSAATIVFLAHRLHHIGWTEILGGLPRSAGFYIAFAIQYFAGAIVEVFIYRGLWGIEIRSLPVFLRKRVYNEAFIDYAGEAHLYLWAKNTLGLPNVRILSVIKDVNLLSGVASNIVTLVLVVGFFAGGYGALLDDADQNLIYALAAAAGLALAVTLGLTLYGSRIFNLRREQSIRITAAHLGRMIFVLGVMVVQWNSALPAVPMAQWLLFLVAQMLLTRLPLLPNRDVMLMWLGVTLAPAIAAPEAHVASMFVAAGALSLLMHAMVFIATSFIPDPPPEPEAAAAQ